MVRLGQWPAAQVRGARKQLLSRRMNEQVHRLNETCDFDEYVCECVHEGCFDPIGLTREDYEQIRRQPARFVVRPGHWCGSDEHVVTDGPLFQVIEKVGDAAAMMNRLAEADEDERLAFALGRHLPAPRHHATR
jgi:hypothetical protein